MKKFFLAVAVLLIAVGIASVEFGCNKSENSTSPTVQVPVYPVTATVLNPLGQPQGGAQLLLQDPPNQAGTFSAYTDTAGKATITAPAGPQVLIAKIGTVFQATINVTVAASSTPTNAGTMQLTQSSTLKVLVVLAYAEQLEDVLTALGFTAFDTRTIESLRDSANTDSTHAGSAKVLAFLKQYSLVFSDCDGNEESDTSFAALSRTYGTYVAGGGKIYGGHYNYNHLRRIWPPYYQDYDYQQNTSRDSLKIIDQNLAGYLGFSVASWDSSTDYRVLSGYEKFTDLPSGSKTYATIYWTNPQIGVIVENYINNGKYLWTDYHNQDIKNVAHLRKIVQYFLYNM